MNDKGLEKAYKEYAKDLEKPVDNRGILSEELKQDLLRAIDEVLALSDPNSIKGSIIVNRVWSILQAQVTTAQVMQQEYERGLMEVAEWVEKNKYMGMGYAWSFSIDKWQAFLKSKGLLEKRW